jgi:hypothetical protein
LVPSSPFLPSRPQAQDYRILKQSDPKEETPKKKQIEGRSEKAPPNDSWLTPFTYNQKIINDKLQKKKKKDKKWLTNIISVHTSSQKIQEKKKKLSHYHVWKEETYRELINLVKVSIHNVILIRKKFDINYPVNLQVDLIIIVIIQFWFICLLI